MLRPEESFTVRWMRYQTSVSSVCPSVGMVNDPDFAPVVGGTNGWMWVAWWKSTVQVKALAGSAPSSGSVAVPE